MIFEILPRKLNKNHSKGIRAGAEAIRVCLLTEDLIVYDPKNSQTILMKTISTNEQILQNFKIYIGLRKNSNFLYVSVNTNTQKYQESNYIYNNMWWVKC